MRFSVGAAALLATVMMLASAGCSSGRAEELSDRWKLNECHANMNTLATDQALFMLKNGRWTGSVAQLDSIGKRRQPLLCPSCGSEYSIDLYDGGYVIHCPVPEHGSIDTGVPSWGRESVAATGASEAR
jgi:hypothetical protein